MDLVTRFEQLCESPPGSLDSSAVIEELPGWGSLQFLGLLAMIDEAYGVSVKPRQLLKCSTIGELAELIKQLRSSSP
jgi:acyl carrier protein